MPEPVIYPPIIECKTVTASLLYYVSLEGLFNQH